jgi:hypothetical protein
MGKECISSNSRNRFISRGHLAEIFLAQERGVEGALLVNLGDAQMHNLRRQQDKLLPISRSGPFHALARCVPDRRLLVVGQFDYQLVPSPGVASSRAAAENEEAQLTAL